MPNHLQWRKKSILVFKRSFKTVSSPTNARCLFWSVTELVIKSLTCITCWQRIQSTITNQKFSGATRTISNSAVIKRNVWNKWKTCKWRDCMTKKLMTHLSCSSHRQKSDTLTIRKVIRFWVTLIRCWSFKILKRWLRTYCAELSKRLRAEDSLFSCWKQWPVWNSFIP